MGDDRGPPRRRGPFPRSSTPVMWLSYGHAGPWCRAIRTAPTGARASMTQPAPPGPGDWRGPRASRPPPSPAAVRPTLAQTATRAGTQCGPLGSVEHEAATCSGPDRPALARTRRRAPTGAQHAALATALADQGVREAASRRRPEDLAARADRDRGCTADIRRLAEAARWTAERDDQTGNAGIVRKRWSADVRAHRQPSTPSGQADARPDAPDAAPRRAVGVGTKSSRDRRWPRATRSSPRAARARARRSRPDDEGKVKGRGPIGGRRARDHGE